MLGVVVGFLVVAQIVTWAAVMALRSDLDRATREIETLRQSSGGESWGVTGRLHTRSAQL